MPLHCQIMLLSVPKPFYEKGWSSDWEQPNLNHPPPPPEGPVCTVLHITSVICLFPSKSAHQPDWMQTQAGVWLSKSFFFFFPSPSSCRLSLQIITPLDQQTLISPLFPPSSFPPHPSVLSRCVLRAYDRRQSVRKSWQ